MTNGPEEPMGDPLSDEDITTSGEAAPGTGASDADGTDSITGDADGTDGTDGSDADATDADGTDGTDGTEEQPKDSDGTDGTAL